ncbi:alpha/beta fold hydrolase [Williamsia sterculiae]|uniref:Pimeloyl-ACP methyl ester carboxylesterase n=1 Tax=Williamsia sterculiae TaxID=1344003 RepID=A0A1N7HEX5_9NOCA|nr:alpha/beta fold hydrolase [Williamsia sterculiae]SIS23426.1 Pimeloyl-ACP methyl ester carboxylesterase [Williamsia sterculiae]
MTFAKCDVGGGIEICFRTLGDPSDPALVLIAGLGLDLTAWPAGIVNGLAAAGLYVISLDNRDAGDSTRVETPPPGRLRQLAFQPRRDAYDLADMAGDTVGLLDHLGIEQAHLVGMSMGGMIAQTIAARHPERVLSLTSIFSTTGSRRVGQPTLATIRLLAHRPARSVEEYVAGHLAVLNHIGTERYPYDAAGERTWARTAWHRAAGDCAAGVARQISAIQKSGDRTDELRRISAPTLVIHGDGDPMVNPTGAEATASAVPGAHLVTIAGMRHHLAPDLEQRLVQLISNHAATDSPSVLVRQGHRSTT